MAARPQGGDGPATSALPVSRHELSAWALRGTGLGTGLLVVGVIALVAQAALDVIVLVLVALLLAAALDPLVTLIRKRSRSSRVQAIGLVYVSLLAMATTFVILLVPAAVDDMNDLAARLPQLMGNARAWATELEPAVIGTTLDRLIDTLDSSFMRAGVISPDADTIVEYSLTAADAVLAVLSVFTMVFFWLISRETLQRFILAMLPLRERHEVRSAWNAVDHRVGYWLRGQLTLMTIVGILSTVAFVILGLPNALLLGVFAGIVEIIPMIGPAIGVIPALISAFLAGGPELALLVVGFYVVIQILEGQILVPIVMKNAVGLPPFLVIVSLLVGGAVGGLIGALLAVPIAAAIVVILKNAQARDQRVALDTPDIGDRDQDPGSEGSSTERASPR